MNKANDKDPFVLAIAEIAANDRSKYIVEWLAQARFNITMGITQSGYTQEAVMRATAQMELLDGILSNIAEAADIAKVNMSINTSMPCVNFSYNLSGKRTVRKPASSEPQPKKSVCTKRKMATRTPTKVP